MLNIKLLRITFTSPVYEPTVLSEGLTTVKDGVPVFVRVAPPDICSVFVETEAGVFSGPSPEDHRYIKQI